MVNTLRIFIETGKKKTFAGGVNWPGWCRSGRDEETALYALIDYGLRYAQILSVKNIEFRVPGSISGLIISEKNGGNASTDFGIPAITLNCDSQPVQQQEFERWQKILDASWQAFDEAVQQAAGRELRKGPRGGGRDLEKIIVHVIEADREYLKRLAWKHKREAESDLAGELVQVRQSIRSALAVAVAGNLPEKGPRGGKIWQPRYFVRRVVWHVLDHVWEIEDRIQE